MKSFGTYTPKETVGIGFTRFAYPRGNTLPRAPVPGEMFYLTQKIDGGHERTSWEPGLYISSGYDWQLFGEQFAKRKTAPIGSQAVDVEVPGNMKRLPKFSEGFVISEVAIKPTTKLTSIAGTASFWTCADKDATLLVTVWRGNELVSFTFDELQAKKLRTIGVSFYDGPQSNQHTVYTLKVNINVPTALYINQAKQLVFDGMSQTAFIVSENN